MMMAVAAMSAMPVRGFSRSGSEHQHGANRGRQKCSFHPSVSSSEVNVAEEAPRYPFPQL
jgi:hypothetical protein